ncbi:ester cyclase [Chitinibacter sp. S2-10]|uniref:ester cyclase n=1 Tax=Chitinibacter sp. S2-10 TaxID=3373597 RepID=UPI003977B719
MKHLIRLVLSLFTFALLQQTALAAPSKSDPLSVVKAYMAGWNKHDANLAASYLDYEVEYYDVTVGESQIGVVPARDNVIKFFIAALPDLKWEMVDEPVVSKDGIAFRWVFTGTNTGIPFEGDKPTGNKISLNGLSLIKVKQGQIVYQGDFYDALTLKKQLGLIK